MLEWCSHAFDDTVDFAKKWGNKGIDAIHDAGEKVLSVVDCDRYS